MGTHTPTYQPNEDLGMAEGYADDAEGRENSQNYYHATTEFRALRPQEYNPAAETGLVAMVVLDAEGVDNGEAQDASLTGSETTSPIPFNDAPMPIDMPKMGLADMSADTQPDTIPQPQATEINALGTKQTVLIVEDTLELAEVIIATLERMNLKTAHETHGDKAVMRFWELNPDVMLLDIGLPDTTGWKIMDAIKERLDATNGEMPKVIIITAQDDPANRLIGKLQGVHNYLIKPFTADEIEAVVMNALNISPAS